MNNQHADQPPPALSLLHQDIGPFYDGRALRRLQLLPEPQDAPTSPSPQDGGHDCLAPSQGTDTTRRHRLTRCTPTKERSRP